MGIENISRRKLTFSIMSDRKKQAFQITPHKRRGPIAAEFQSPGPAAVSLPSAFGKSPSMSMTKRPKDAKQVDSPAANSYQAVLPEKKSGFAFGIKHPYT